LFPYGEILFYGKIPYNIPTMRRTFSFLTVFGFLSLLLFPLLYPAEGKEKRGRTVRVEIQTNLGKFVVELYPEKAPITVKNFLRYVDEGFYNGTIFHRVIPGFVIQGGGFTTDLTPKPTHPPIQNEAGNGLKNERGTIAMARTSEIHSATSQFYINLKDNPFLDYTSPTPEGYGYAVFGRVISGMEVVDKIATIPTGTQKGMANVPLQPVIILKARRLK